MADITNPHFRVPFFVGKSVAAVEQDSDEEVRQCVEAVVRTEVGTRIERPEFGIFDPTFQEFPGGVDEIAAAVEEWEPRVRAAPRATIERAIERVQLTYGHDDNG